MRFYTSPLIQLTKEGLFCEAGGFHIDPKRAVDTAIVTHAHSDHARRGSRRYLCAAPGVGLLRSRLGKKIEVQGIAYQEKFQLGKVQVSLHSAGHILGSAQVRVEYAGEVWVASGDYKREADPSCDPFEVVPCDTFITEATFGAPKFRWEKHGKHGENLWDWWQKNRKAGRNSILFGYSLGKAQRILAELAPFADRPIIIHSSISELTECYRAEGWKLAATLELSEALALKSEAGFQGEMILAPPSILKEGFNSHFGAYHTAFASGWMQSYSPWGQGGYDHGFVMSDHADWNDLNETVLETGAKRVFVQHRNGALIRNLRKQGIDAHGDETLILENFDRLGGQEMSFF
ncbi:MAG: ligase-associated DNA damage response exonuclease [Bdellovibrionales bacterium]|nr:ligase-associated DNA damage response exonuclease [Oligoflexia bacterium]